jgi:hypothetical protein
MLQLVAQAHEDVGVDGQRRPGADEVRVNRLPKLPPFLWF